MLHIGHILLFKRAKFGIYGLLWGTVIHSAICTLINMWLVSKHIGYKTLSQLKDILPIMTVFLRKRQIIHSKSPKTIS